MRTLRAIATGCVLAMLAIPLASVDARAGDASQKPYDSAIQYALEKLVSGIHTETFFGGVEVDVTPVRTWKSVSGHWCREYDITVRESDASPERERSTRCRDQGYWKLAK